VTSSIIGLKSLLILLSENWMTDIIDSLFTDNGISILGDIQKLSGCGSGQSVLGDPA